MDVQPLVGTGGIATYTRNLLCHLEGVRVIPVFGAVRGLDRVRLELPPGLEDRPIVPPLAWRLAHRIRPIAGLLPGFEWVARLPRADLVHGPNYFVPRSDLPAVVTVHDLTALRFPRWHTAAVRERAAKLARAVHQARLTIADSEATAADLVALLGLPAHRVRVIPLAAEEFPGLAEDSPRAPGERPDPGANPAPAAGDQAILARLGIDRPYVLHVGALEPRKNLVRLIRAFGAAVGGDGTRWAFGREGARGAGAIDGREGDYLLVLAGPEAWGAAEVRAAASGDRRVLILGNVSRAELGSLYRQAACFAYPSHFEGFGLPVLEAMACGAPVVASTGGSLPEVVGDAGLLVDPQDERALAGAIRQILFEPGVAEDLSRRGRERAAGFSWRRTADLTREVYLEALGG